MKIKFTTRGETSDFWPEFDDAGQPVWDPQTGAIRGQYQHVRFDVDDVLDAPPPVATKLINLGVAEAA